MAKSYIALIAYAVVLATAHADHGTPDRPVLHASADGRRVSQPLRTADQQRQRRGCQSPSVTELAASGQLLMTAAFPCPGCCCEYLTTAAQMPARPRVTPVCSISRTTALAWHDAVLSLDWASPVTWIGWAVQGATRLGRDSYQAPSCPAPHRLRLQGSCTRRQPRTGQGLLLSAAGRGPARPASRLRWCASHADARRGPTPCPRPAQIMHRLILAANRLSATAGVSPSS